MRYINLEIVGPCIGDDKETSTPQVGDTIVVVVPGYKIAVVTVETIEYINDVAWIRWDGNRQSTSMYNCYRFAIPSTVM